MRLDMMCTMSILLIYFLWCADARNKPDRVSTESETHSASDTERVVTDERRCLKTRKLLSDEGDGGNDTYENTTSMVIEARTGNVTGSNSTDGTAYEELASWLLIFDTVQNTITGIGFLANILTIVTLYKNGSGFPKVINFLLRHQSYADAVVCALAILLIAPPPMWMTGNTNVDLILCQVWHGQALYWGGVFMSIVNLILIAIERYMAIVHPFVHKTLSVRHFKITLVIMYFVSFFIEVMPGYLQVRYVDGECLGEYYFTGETMKSFMFFYGIYIFMTFYAIPCLLFIFFYGSVVWTLTKRNKQSTLGQSKVFSNAQQQLTRTATVVTVFFLITLGYDLWYYILGNTGVVEYVKNSAVQKVGVFMAVMNSCGNPLIYAAFMPAYRNSLKKTLLCRNGDSSSSNGTSSSGVNSSTNTSMTELPETQNQA